ncbi:MAG: AMP-binding protein [Prolixibacteraceae bacterium]|nr:AMP-binding protein [Prolixibacteraceae bacterium]
MRQVIQINGKKLSCDNIGAQIGCGDMPEWKSQVFRFIHEWFNDEPYIRQQTSGSTGAPKEVELPKSGMVASAENTLKYFNLKKNDIAWLCLPVHYIAGKMMVVRAAIGGLNLVLTEPSSTPDIPRQHIAFTAMVPMQVHSLIATGYGFNNISKIIIGGAAVDRNLKEKLQNVPAEIYATYGMTETASHIALQKLNGQNPDDCFHVLPGFSVSKNADDCLVIEASQFSEKPLQTTDVVELLSSSKFRWLGRSDNVINSGGIKISPEPLETVISSVLGRECVVSSLKDEKLGEQLVLVLEGKKSSGSNATLLEKISHVAGKHRIPKAIHYIEEFPRTKSLKIDRLKIKKAISS